MSLNNDEIIDRAEEAVELIQSALTDFKANSDVGDVLRNIETARYDLMALVEEARLA